jgi:hypothetical protein
VGQDPPNARQARVAELTASSRLTGVRPDPGDTVLEGVAAPPEGVAVSEGEAVGEGVVSGNVDLGATVGAGRVAEGAGRDGEGWPAKAGWAARERDLSSTASKDIRAALTKTNPPMATFGQLPFRLSGMRRSLTGRAADRGRDRPSATIGGPGPSGRRPSRETW